MSYSRRKYFCKDKKITVKIRESIKLAKNYAFRLNNGHLSTMLMSINKDMFRGKIKVSDFQELLMPDPHCTEPQS